MSWTRYKDLTGLIFGKLTVISKFAKKDKCTILWNCLCECGNSKITSSISLKRKIRPIKNCGCQTSKLKSEINKLPKGEAHLNRLFRQYIHNAKRRNIIFELKKEEFQKLITNNCNICDISPKKVNYKSIKYINGFINHNGIDRIDNNKGYIINNVQTMCIDCNRAKSNMTKNDFHDWINRIIETQNKIKKRVG